MPKPHQVYITAYSISDTQRLVRPLPFTVCIKRSVDKQQRGLQPQPTPANKHAWASCRPVGYQSKDYNENNCLKSCIATLSVLLLSLFQFVRNTTVRREPHSKPGSVPVCCASANCSCHDAEWRSHSRVEGVGPTPPLYPTVATPLGIMS